MSVVVGVDGGGTRASAVAIDETGRELVRLQGASVPETAVASLHTLSAGLMGVVIRLQAVSPRPVART